MDGGRLEHLLKVAQGGGQVSLLRQPDALHVERLYLRRFHCRRRGLARQGRCVLRGGRARIIDPLPQPLADAIQGCPALLQGQGQGLQVIGDLRHLGHVVAAAATGEVLVHPGDEGRGVQLHHVPGCLGCRPWISLEQAELGKEDPHAGVVQQQRCHVRAQPLVSGCPGVGPGPGPEVPVALDYLGGFGSAAGQGEPGHQAGGQLHDTAA